MLELSEDQETFCP